MTETSRRNFLALGGGALGAATLGLGKGSLSGGAGAPGKSPSSDTGASRPGGGGPATTVTGLRTAAMTNPLGIDFAAPTLGWQIAGDSPAAAQHAYQIQVATSESALSKGHPDLWDTGRVPSSQNYNIPYRGSALKSRTRAYWRVRIWDGHDRPTGWSATAHWEMGLLKPSDWTAKWIGNAEWEQPHAIAIPLTAPQTARYVRMTVTDLGRPPVALNSPDWAPQLQMAEITVIDSTKPDVNLALGAAVTAPDTVDVPGQWGAQYLTDGKLTSLDAPYGYQSTVHDDTDVSDNPIVITLDLATSKTFDQVYAYQRWDAPGPWGITPDYPRSIKVAVSDSPTGPFTQVGTVSKDDKPYPPSSMHAAPAGLPMFAKQFTVRGHVDHARLYVSAAGVQVSTLNGHSVGDAVLEPPNTNVHDELEYATYDVTDLLTNGTNVLGVELGTGIWDVFDTPADPNRYIKAQAGFGPPRLIGQLEITYANGRRDTVATDGSWQTSLGATTFSNWYGGEDHDARREQPGWNTPHGDRKGWTAAVRTASPMPGTALVGRMANPIQIVETHPATAVTNPSDGVYVLDFGVNAAGWQQLRMNGPAGTVVKMLPGEKLTSAGLVDQSTTGSPIYDTYTMAGTGDEVWSPRFMYHGFRYLEVHGLPAAPAVADAKTLVLRAANTPVASFTTSNPLINSIHQIIDRALRSNQFSVLTDCPHREKLGWLDDVGLIPGVMSRNYDVEATYRKIARDMVEAQTDEGMVPTIAPEITLFAGAFRDDSNWGGTIVLGPWHLYRTYGDLDTMRTCYPAMRRYVDYLKSKAVGNLLDGGLGDWITPDATTPTEVTETYGYKRIVSTLADIAATLGESADAANYRALAGQIVTAFNAKYLNATTATYSVGNQACNALALDGGFVPPANYPAVLTTLVNSIQAAGNTLNVGEIALPAAIRVLAQNGRQDVLYAYAALTSNPSYGHQVVTGSTSLGEDWGGMGTSGSQNHWMLGAIDEWFLSGIGGISQSDSSIAYRDLVIAPAVGGDLTSASSSYLSPQGKISCSWALAQGALTLSATVPGNSTATVHVPLVPAGGTSASVTAPSGAKLVSRTATEAVYRVGPGDWTFHAHA